ncbi:hypothetical protein ACLOJK_000049 [Asimina triloba]
MEEASDFSNYLFGCRGFSYYGNEGSNLYVVAGVISVSLRGVTGVTVWALVSGQVSVDSRRRSEATAIEKFYEQVQRIELGGWAMELGHLFGRREESLMFVESLSWGLPQNIRRKLENVLHQGIETTVGGMKGCSDGVA